MTHSETELAICLKNSFYIFSTAQSVLFKESYNKLGHKIQLKSSFFFFLKPSLFLSLPSSSPLKKVKDTIMPVITCYVIFIALQFITNVFVGGTKYLNRFSN